MLWQRNSLAQTRGAILCEPMRVHPASAQVPDDARGAALALGNFDGVHRGHQAVIASARAAADALNTPLGVAVFAPHPRRVFQPDAAPFRLQTNAQRARALAALGVDHLYEIAFTRETASLSDEAFAKAILSQRLGARHVSVGADFRFGRGRMGDADSLMRLGEHHGFSADAVAPVSNGEEKFSSTAIRAAIAKGDMDAAARMLSRPWAIEGTVLRGFQRGRTIGVPTANVALGEYAHPRLGVYAVRVDVGDGALRAGVASVGVNPTVGALPAPLLEAHIFDFDGDLYGRTIETQLFAFLRPEATFASMDEMARQIESDATQARALLA
ncbi:riboflavin kinase [alpha proteobacterium U9-1i]|nr:riboflavin kinase [alpha proteobacterium U9-1i]